MFTPILVATPRTGSSLICQLLSDICTQTSNYKNDLQEFFTIEAGYESTYSLKETNGEIVITTALYREVPKLPLWFGNYSNIPSMIADRAEMLSCNPHRYMIKIFSGQLATNKKSSDYIKNFLYETYTPVYLERRDILAQFFSQMYASQQGRFHWDANETAHAMPINFKFEYFLNFINLLRTYKAEKKAWPGSVIVYEDFLSKGKNHQALIDILDLKISHTEVTPSVVKTVPTPYNFDYKDFLNADLEWIKHKNQIEDFCLNYTHDIN